jgi:hypothetical protein
MLQRITLCLGLLLPLLASPAFAQQQQKEPDPMQLQEDERKKAAEDVDRRYKATLQKTSKETAPTRVDPWSNFRGAGDGKR